MSCPREFRLAVYADGELSGEESAEVALHLDVCGACKERVRVLEAESRWLTRSLREVDAAPEAVRSPVSSPVPLSSPSVWPLAAGVTGSAAVLSLFMHNALSIDLPAGLEWLDPSGLPDRIALVANALFYVIREGIPMISATAARLSLALLNMFVLTALILCGRKVRFTGAALAGLMLCAVVPARAIDIRSDNEAAVVIGADEVIDDTLAVFASSVDIDGTVNGALIVFAVTGVDIRGTVNGNLIVVTPRRFALDGVVTGDVVAIADNLSIRGQVLGDLWTGSKSGILDASARIGGNMMVIGSETEVEGEVARDLAMIGNLLNLSGHVGEGVKFRGFAVNGAALIVRESASVGGNLAAIVAGEEQVQIDPGASIGGTRSIEIPEPRPSRFATVSFYVNQLLRIVTGFLVGWLLFRVFPGLGRVDLGSIRTLLTSGGVGFLAGAAAPVATLVLAITVIGLPLAFLVGFGWIAGLYLSKIAVAGFVGAAVVGRNARGVTTATGLLLGLILVVIAVNLPFVGWLVNWLLMLIGFGSLVMGTYQMVRGPKAQPAV